MEGEQTDYDRLSRILAIMDDMNRRIENLEQRCVELSEESASWEATAKRYASEAGFQNTDYLSNEGHPS